MPTALPFTTNISQGLTLDTSYKTRVIKYGNGVEQRIPDGINNEVRSGSLTYENMSAANKDTLIAAVKSLAGTDYFTWTPFGEVTQLKFKVLSHSVTYSSGNLYNITLQLEQVYF
jgi:phage-related protein